MVTRTARDLNGMARVTRHQRPQVGAVGSVGDREGGAAHLGERGGGDAGAPGGPAMPRPMSPTQPTTATARPEPAGPVRSAPNQMKRAVATTCQTMFWKASSPAIQPQVKLRTVKGSRRMGR